VGAKVRPVVLLTRDAVIRRLTSYVVAPCTTTVRNLPSEVPLDESDGVPKPCVVNLDNITLVTASAVKARITTLPPAKMSAICSAIEVAVGCDRR
jgi:mRNA interferase MazF